MMSGTLHIWRVMGVTGSSLEGLDRLSLKKMVFYGYHGVIPAEKELGQKWEVDVDLWLNLRQAGVSDDLAATIDYFQVYLLIKQLVEERHFRLVEALAEAIAQSILESQRGTAGLANVTVRVRKLQPPIAGILECAEVEITRP